jgi:GDP/UDP-N,N'-diacetylbacillosamine 2-epimerase (hydrolysing)
MKTICFPATSSIHLARQKLLLHELKKYFRVDIWIPKEEKGGMSTNSILYFIQFNNYLNGKNFDYAIIRGDRYELLPITAACVYRGISVIHIEGGDTSGVIDNRIRRSITMLADIHFATNKESYTRLISQGTDPDLTFNLGSLDVEFAIKVKKKSIKGTKGTKGIAGGRYLFVAYHPIENEDEEELEKALSYFKGYDIIRVKSNKDYGRGYGNEEFTPEDYINLMRGAKCCIGNSSSLIKEASVLEVPVVLIGDRQKNRLLPSNVLHIPCTKEKIKLGIQFQLQNKYDKDLTYYHKDTSKSIAKKIKEL